MQALLEQLFGLHIKEVHTGMSSVWQGNVLQGREALAFYDRDAVKRPDSDEVLEQVSWL